ncbi:MAG: SdpI family protein [Anaerolineae bacterium]
MLWFGLLIGGIFILAGLATAIWAPRVGPNAYFGVRTGYSAANRAVWNRSNRVGGLVMAALGVVMLVITVLIVPLHLPAETEMLVLTGALFALLIPAVVWLFFYTRRLSRTMLPGDPPPD